jgi:hypothetical protein
MESFEWHTFFPKLEKPKIDVAGCRDRNAIRWVENQLDSYAVVAAQFLMQKQLVVTRITPSMDGRIKRAAALNFDDRSEIVRQAADIGLSLICEKNWKCDDHYTFEDRSVRLSVRIDTTLFSHLTELADHHWTTRAGVLRAALHYGLCQLGAPLGR